MIAPACRHDQVKRFGRNRNGSQRFRCVFCGLTWTENRPQPIGDMRIDAAKAAQVLEMLMEGVSIRATVRLTGVAKGTILNLLETIGRRAVIYWRTKMQNLPATDVQVDEIWDFIGCKEKKRQKKHYGEEWGDCYTFTAIERTSKLMLAFWVGRRTTCDTANFAEVLRAAVLGRCQMTSDGFPPYEQVIPAVFQEQVDFAQLIKVYGTPKDGDDTRYSPGAIVDVRMHAVCGHPFPDKVCTSHVERQNLNIRMGIRRMTRLTNGFSKKRENHEYHLAVYFLYYNFCRPHMTLSKGKKKGQRGVATTPAMVAGLTNHVWTLTELLNQLATHC